MRPHWWRPVQNPRSNPAKRDRVPPWMSWSRRQITRRSGRFAFGAAIASLWLLTPSNAHAQVSCGDDGAGRVALSAGLGVASGATGALISSGIVASVDDTRDYEFYVGTLVGIGVTTGLSAVYAIYDGSTGCDMANNSSLGVVWSVPIVMLVLGSLLPIAVWGASDEFGAPTEMPDAMSDPAGGWGFSF